MYLQFRPCMRVPGRDADIDLCVYHSIIREAEALAQLGRGCIMVYTSRSRRCTRSFI